MNGDILLSPKESRRVYILEQLVTGSLTSRQAAELLGISQRQVKRLKKAFLAKGVQALSHGNRGRKPHHALPETLRTFICTLALSDYEGASCQHMAELLLQEHGVSVSAKSIRRILAQAGIAHPHSHAAPRKHRARPPMPREGILVQVDASPLDWLEGRGPLLHLHGAIDDATCKILGLFFAPQECLAGYLEILHQIFVHHGVPVSLYSDRHTIFFSPKKERLSLAEELAGQAVPRSQFGRVLADFGVHHIPARSPQAKGRIERLWRTLQSRLRIELRRAGIASIPDANDFLPHFIQRFNQRFARAPQETPAAYRPTPAEFEKLLATRVLRKASHGSLISFQRTKYQLIDANGKVLALDPKTVVTVLTHRDGSISARYKQTYYRLQPFHELAPSTALQENRQTVASKPIVRKPAHDHPWRHWQIKPKAQGDPKSYKAWRYS